MSSPELRALLEAAPLRIESMLDYHPQWVIVEALGWGLVEYEGSHLVLTEAGEKVRREGEA